MWIARQDKEKSAIWGINKKDKVGFGQMSKDKRKGEDFKNLSTRRYIVKRESDEKLLKN